MKKESFKQVCVRQTDWETDIWSPRAPVGANLHIWNALIEILAYFKAEWAIQFPRKCDHCIRSSLVVVSPEEVETMDCNISALPGDWCGFSLSEVESSRTGGSNRGMAKYGKLDSWLVKYMGTGKMLMFKFHHNESSLIMWLKKSQWQEEKWSSGTSCGQVEGRNAPVCTQCLL